MFIEKYLLLNAIAGYSQSFASDNCNAVAYNGFMGMNKIGTVHSIDVGSFYFFIILSLYLCASSFLLSALVCVVPKV